MRRDGKVFRTEDGRIWHYRGATSMLLLYRLLIGEDIDPILDQWQTLGANVLRVLCGVGWDHLEPRFFPRHFGHYWAGLRALISRCAARGLRLELVIFADAQIVMPTESEQRAFANEVGQFVRDDWNVLLETCNEPFKNGVDVARVVPPAGRVLRATGKYDLPDSTIGAPGPNLQLPHLEYVTIHGERKDEWPRTGKDLQELRDGWAPGVNANDQAFRGLDGVGCPVVADEGMGADEEDQPGRRSNVPADFRDFAACCALMGAGATFHSTDGLNAVLLRPRQYACAWAFYAAFLHIPPAAQIAAYARGDADGWPAVGNMPMEHFDADGPHTHDGALRTFCKEVEGIQYCIAIRPGPAWHAEARGGWRILDEPARGLVRLTR